MGFLTYFSYIAAEVDKRIKFRKVLSVEYMLTMKKYSNTEFIFRFWHPLVTGMVTFLIFYTPFIYKIFLYQEERTTVVRFLY